MQETTAPDPRLPDEVPPPEVFGRGTWPIVPLVQGRTAGSPGPEFPVWAARQYSQLLAPIHYSLHGSSRVSVAARANLSRNSVQAALDGASWPQLQTVIRLAHVAGVELFALAGRDLVEHGPPLPPDEQALLLAYRRLPAEARAGMRQQAIRVISERQQRAAQQQPPAVGVNGGSTRSARGPGARRSLPSRGADPLEQRRDRTSTNRST